MAHPKTPHALGYRLPAEWAPHAATWIAWPHNTRDWPGKFAPIPWVYAEIVRALIAAGETVRVLVRDAAMERRARNMLARAHADPAKVEFFCAPTDRCWTRDTCPAFVVRDSKKDPAALVRFRFNAWAKYDNWQQDAAVPGLLEQALGLRAFEARIRNKPFVLEGGAIDANGRGTLLTTEECLLDSEVQARNPGAGRADVEAALRDFLGARNVLWLGRGIAGDDTHGHVDDLCRFVSPDTVALCREDDPRDENYAPLAENRERLRDMRLEDGSAIHVVDLPMPRPLVFEGCRLPASYANFYIANQAVLVPTFNDSADREALGILSECFPNRAVVGIHAVDLVWGFGTLHCLAREQAAGKGIRGKG